MHRTKQVKKCSSKSTGLRNNIYIYGCIACAEPNIKIYIDLTIQAARDCALQGTMDDLVWDTSYTDSSLTALRIININIWHSCQTLLNMVCFQKNKGNNAKVQK